MKRELKGRSAIEPVIGHAKNDGRLGRNFLLGPNVAKVNDILAVARQNLRLSLKHLAFLDAWFLAGIASILTAKAPTWALRA